MQYKIETKIYNDMMNNIQIIEMSCGIRVITYNVLTQKYAQPSYYPTIRKDYLTEEYRWDRLDRLLRAWIRAGFIICLQEVSTAWDIKVSELFAQNSYMYCGYCYNDGIFGTSIAFNTKAFHLLDTQNISIGRYIGNLNLRRPENSMIPEEDIVEAITQNNLLISVLLKCKNNKHPTKFIISTYHMPCRFLAPYVMYMHIIGIRHHLNHLTEYYSAHNINSIVLAGDMNVTPSSQLYQMFGNSGHRPHDMMNELKEMDHFIEDNKLHEKLIHLESVFKKNKIPEPEYTNVSIQKNRTFIGTIDYILVTQPIICKSCVVGLTVPNPLVSGYPNGLSPSDHLPVSASLFIQ